MKLFFFILIGLYSSVSFAVFGGQLISRLDAARSPLVKLIYPGGIICSGVLVEKNIVLTAAHCLNRLDRLVVEVRYEMLENGVGSNFSLTENYKVADAIGHPLFNMNATMHIETSRPQIKYDIALIKIVGQAPEHKPLANILKDHSQIDKVLETSNGGVVMGHGQTPEGEPGRYISSGEIYSPNLTDFIVPMWGLSASDFFYSTNNEVLIADGRQGAHMCYGDSGGPVFGSSPINGNPWTVMAINSVVIYTKTGSKSCFEGSGHAVVSHPKNKEFLRDGLGKLLSN